jgi:hypothetical protein
LLQRAQRVVGFALVEKKLFLRSALGWEFVPLKIVSRGLGLVALNGFFAKCGAYKIPSKTKEFTFGEDLLC